MNIVGVFYALFSQISVNLVFRIVKISLEGSKGKAVITRATRLRAVKGRVTPENSPIERL